MNVKSPVILRDEIKHILCLINVHKMVLAHLQEAIRVVSVLVACSDLRGRKYCAKIRVLVLGHHSPGSPGTY